MKYITLLAAAAALVLGVASCDELPPEEQNIDNEYKALVLTTKSAEFVQKGCSFSFDYISRINAETDKDYIVSPLSMQFLLGMILNGAKGQTADEICSVLGYGAGEIDAVNEFCLSMLQQLPSLDKKTKLTLADAIFVDEGFPLEQAYKNAVSNYYEAVVKNLPFAQTEASTAEINKWCYDHTNGMIPKVLDEVSTDMLAYILNALYFKSSWTDKFEKGMTASEDFKDEAGKSSKAKMMKRFGDYRYAENDIYQAVRLPYGNGAYSMTVLLPQKGHTVAQVCEALKTSDWKRFYYDFSSCDVNLWIPKFETKFRIQLKDILSAMGMPTAFDSENADLSAMSPFALRVSFIQQDAVIKVDEEGTEAAAVSMAGIEKVTSVGPGKTVVFHADHPFLYLITENSSGAVLFAGRYSNQ